MAQFLINPPLPTKLRLSRGLPISSTAYMRSVVSWATWEHKEAMSYYERRNMRKEFLFVKYQLSPAKVLALHPLFSELCQVVRQDDWDRLSREEQSVLVEAFKEWKSSKRVH
jgi:hypothetical protein